jgi:hypothetical protein
MWKIISRFAVTSAMIFFLPIESWVAVSGARGCFFRPELLVTGVNRRRTTSILLKNLADQQHPVIASPLANRRAQEIGRAMQKIRTISHVRGQPGQPPSLAPPPLNLHHFPAFPAAHGEWLQRFLCPRPRLPQAARRSLRASAAP